MLQQFRCVGTKGEFAVNLLDKLAQELVNETLCLGDDARTLITQTQAWLGKILNPVTIRINPLRVNILELLIDGFKPSNVGFGYSSILPIIVTGLIAKPNEKIIIENPEIHLHPKAQSALIEFLVKVANTGVQIFIESHSDHIINGILVQCKKFEESSENGISKNDVSLLYFDSDETGKNGRTTKINIEENGRIRYTPKGFFDQFTIDRKFLMGF
jgi:predicted ATPase